MHEVIKKSFPRWASSHACSHTSIVFHGPRFGVKAFPLFFQASIPTTRGPLHITLTCVCVCFSRPVLFSLSHSFLCLSLKLPFLLFFSPLPLSPHSPHIKRVTLPPSGHFKTHTATRWHKWWRGGCRFASEQPTEALVIFSLHFLLSLLKYFIHLSLIYVIS